MLLSDVAYARPGTIDEALGLLAEHEGARPLAGGQTLINVMKARAAAPDVLVDLNGIAELKGIELGSDGTLEIGPMTTTSELIASQEARARPILAEVCSQIADVQVRNRGTVGGNICSSDPTNHLPPLMVATGAEMTIAGPSGERTVPAGEFFLGVYMTAVGQGELLTRITIPPGRSDGFASVAVGRDGTCIVNAAASANATCTVRATTAALSRRSLRYARRSKPSREWGPEWRLSVRRRRQRAGSPSRSTAPRTNGTSKRVAC
jgi:carbon-monoxide dehydrogenase medium subunit